MRNPSYASAPHASTSPTRLVAIALAACSACFVARAASPEVATEAEQHGAAATRAGDSVGEALPALTRDDWLRLAIVEHGFTRLEAAAASGLSAQEVERWARERSIEVTGRPRNVAGELRVLPYPGGRHPRIGFLDGAIDPHRDTKASVFLPWEGGGYVVLDLPEALWTHLGLTYLAHTHIPTIWDERQERLPRIDWTRLRSGGLRARRVLPNGIAFRATVQPAESHVDLELAVENGTQERLRGLRAQVCVLLKSAVGFRAQTSTNKLRDGRVIAVRSDDGRRWIVTVWERARPWDNPPCPCMHSDPVFPELEPGEESVLRGRLFFWEGEDLRAELERRRALGTLEPPPAEPRTPRRRGEAEESAGSGDAR